MKFYVFDHMPCNLLEWKLVMKERESYGRDFGVGDYSGV